VPLEPLELLALDSCVQSPEAPLTVRAEFESFLGCTVTEIEVREAFTQLVALGFAEIDSRGPHSHPNDAWFYATPAGRAAVDREWDIVFPDVRGR